MPATVVNGNSSCLIQFFSRICDRVHADLGGELVHQPLDGVRRLGPAGAAVGVGPGLVGEDGLARELVGRELVDRVEHERARAPARRRRRSRRRRPRSASRSTLRPVTVPSFSAARVSFCHWSRPWWPAEQRLRAGLGVLDRLVDPPADRPGDPLLGRDLELAAEPAADVGCDHPDLRLGHAGRRGQREPHDVRDLGGRPHRVLLAGRVHHDRARLHERRDQPLLAVLALDHDAVGAGRSDGLLDIAAGARLGGVEDPQRGLVGARGPGARGRCRPRPPSGRARPAARRTRRRRARRRRAPRRRCGRRPRRRSRRRRRPGRWASASASA